MKGRGYLWAFTGFTEFLGLLYRVLPSFSWLLPRNWAWSQRCGSFTGFLPSFYWVFITSLLLFLFFFVCIAVACRNGAISSLFFCLFLFIFRFFGPKSRGKEKKRKWNFFDAKGQGKAKVSVHIFISFLPKKKKKTDEKTKKKWKKENVEEAKRRRRRKKKKNIPRQPSFRFRGNGECQLHRFYFVNFTDNSTRLRVNI